MARASSAAPLPGAAFRSRIRSASAGSASIISVMWKGGAPRRLGCEVERQGSGGPGSGAVGSKVAVLIGGA